MSIPDWMTSEQAIESYRGRFGEGPIGQWFPDMDMNLGWWYSIEFQADGTGHNFVSDDEGEITEPFCWEYLGDRRIDLRPHPDTPEDSASCKELWRTIEYDFAVRKDGYGTRDVYMFEKNARTPDANGVPVFWTSCHPLLLDESPSFLIEMTP